MSSSPRPPTLPPGVVVDDTYEILHILGQGGVAQVYKALHLGLQAPVALKLLRTDFGSEATRLNQERRLLNEARAAASIRHPNVVQVREIKQQLKLSAQGRSWEMAWPYLVMDHLEGESLADALHEQGPMAPTRALPLFLECLEGLAEGHKLGIVHKDLKPDNLFLTWPGTRRETLVILDFGTARMHEALTQENNLPFTPNYVAPEYITGHVVSPAVDVYQMGLILVELLTGRPAVPFEKMTDCLLAHKQGRLDIPAWIYDSPIGPIVQSATALEHTERIVDAAIFRKVLSRIDPATIVAPAHGT